jgi:hypothetical protein
MSEGMIIDKIETEDKTIVIIALKKARKNKEINEVSLKEIPERNAVIPSPSG